MINITKPFLPPEQEYQKYLSEIWERNWLTNNGVLVTQLESKLKEKLDLSNLLFVTNGTIAIQLAIKALELKGEIITTPFSYVATTSSIVWEGLTPVFVDIDKDTLNIDPTKIESAITDRTCAILATHVYGNPCNIGEIDRIAKSNNLKVIYDAAHCFGTKYENKSVLEYGDVSAISFHATKLFHTVEGGAVISKDPLIIDKINYSRNFGHFGPESFKGLGINGKNSELHAAMGLCNLKYVDHVIEKRKSDYKKYVSLLSNSKIKEVSINSASTWNFSYVPIIFETERACINVLKKLETNDIYARRYFYPTLNSLSYVNSQEMTTAESISSRVLCLPSYYDVTDEAIEQVCRIIKDAIGK